jgi:hypothetical protein
MMKHRHRRGRNAERLSRSDRLLEPQALALLISWERGEAFLCLGVKDRCPDKGDSSTHLTPGDSRADPSLAVIGRLRHGESRGQVVPELSRLKLPSVGQFSIEAGVQRLTTPFRAYKACGLQSHLRGVKHSTLGPAHGRVHETFL